MPFEGYDPEPFAPATGPSRPMSPFAEAIEQVLHKHLPEDLRAKERPGPSELAASRFPDPRDLLVLPVPARTGFVAGEFPNFFVLNRIDRRGGKQGYADLIQQEGGFIGKTEIKPEFALTNESTPRALLPFLRDTALPYFGIEQSNATLRESQPAPASLDPLDWETSYLEQAGQTNLLERLSHQRNRARARILTALMPTSPEYQKTFARMGADQEIAAKKNIANQLATQPKAEQDRHAAKLLNSLAERQQIPAEELQKTLDAIVEITARVPTLDQAFKQIATWNQNQLHDYFQQGTAKYESLKKDDRVLVLSRIYFLFAQIRMLEAGAKEFIAFTRQDQEQLLLRLARDAGELRQIQRTRGEVHRVLGTLAYLTGNLIAHADQLILPEFKAESPSTLNRFMDRVRCIPGSGIVEADRGARFQARQTASQSDRRAA